jgi:hypothetical protein
MLECWFVALSVSSSPTSGHFSSAPGSCLGIRLIVFFLAAFALYLPFHRVRRHRLIRVFRQARSSPDDLKAQLENGTRVSIRDRAAGRALEKHSGAAITHP